MAYFTQEQCEWLESLGAARLRPGSECFHIEDREILGHIFIECVAEDYDVEISTVGGIDVKVSGDDLKKTLMEALKRYHHEASVIMIMNQNVCRLIDKIGEDE